MKFMLSWRLHDDKRQEALAAFSAMTEEDDAADAAGITMIGRWHDLVGFTGLAIFEADDSAAIANWALNWNGILDAEVIPMWDDEECRAIGQARG